MYTYLLGAYQGWQVSPIHVYGKTKVFTEFIYGRNGRKGTKTKFIANLHEHTKLVKIIMYVVQLLLIVIT